MKRTILSAKYCFFMSIIYLMIGCAVPQPEMNAATGERINLKEITDNDTREDIPENFEKTMPESSIILNGMVVFEKKYITETISDNVSDFSYDNETFVFLKNDILYSNDKLCSSINIKNKPQGIRLSDGLILTYGSNEISVYSINDCGKIFSLKRAFSKISFFSPYIIQYNRNEFSISKVGSTKRPLTGGLKIPIENIYYFNGKVYFLLNQNRLVPLVLTENINGELVGSFTNPIPLPENSNIITSDGNYLYLGKNNYIAQYELSDISLNKKQEYKIEDTEGCQFIQSNALKCGDEIFSYSQNKFFKLGNVEKAHTTDNSILYLKKNILNAIYTDEKHFVKEILLNKPDISLCRTETRYFLNDWDGKIKEIDIYAYSSKVVSKIPEDCSYGFDFKGGYFIDNKNNIKIKVAEKVNENDNYNMYLRKIGDNYYYYFEKKDD